MAVLECTDGFVGVSQIVEGVNDRLDLAGGTLTGNVEAPSMTIGGETVAVISDLSQNAQLGGVYSITNEENGFLKDVYVAGDSSVELGHTEVSCNRTGDMATVTLSVDITGFTYHIPTDDRISFKFDLLRRCKERGWFNTIESWQRGMGQIYMSGPGRDAPVMSMYSSVGSDGWVYLVIGEYPAYASADMNRMICDASFTFKVA